MVKSIIIPQDEDVNVQILGELEKLTLDSLRGAS